MTHPLSTLSILGFLAEDQKTFYTQRYNMVVEAYFL